MGRSIAALVALAVVVCACLCNAQVSAAEDEIITPEWEEVVVSVENGPTFSISIDKEDTVQTLVEEIHELEGIPASKITPALGTTAIDFYAKLSQYNIRGGSRVTLLLPEERYRQGAEFIVRTLDGRELPVATTIGNTVASLKDNITRLAGIPRAQQRLLLKGKELKDERRLGLYEIYDRTIINLAGPLEDCQAETATIIVKTLSDATIEIEASLADTVNELKERILRRAGVPAGVQHLFANERLISGEDHLCDLGLETGSVVYMFLDSPRITSPNQVASLQEPPTLVDPHKAPIFREVERDAREESGRRAGASIYKDARNWIVRDHSRPGWEPELIDPVAHLEPNPDDDKWWAKEYDAVVQFLSRPNMSESDRQEGALMLSGIKLSSAIRSYRVAANLIRANLTRHQHGFTLGGGSADARQKQQVPLGADVNNWAPDAFSDADLVRLFELSERVRRVLAKSAQTGEGILDIASQRRINQAILMTYYGALAGYPPAVEHNQAGESAECGVCHDDLTAEPAVKLTCGHAFHADCIVPWVLKSYQRAQLASCPFCRKRFMFSYDILGKAELETPELCEN